MNRQRIGAFFNIQAGEGHVVGLIFALYFFMGIGFVLTQTASYALFIDTFGSEGIPYTYIGIAVGVSLLAFGYLRLDDHVPLSRLLIVNLSVLIGVSVVLRVGLVLTQARWLVFLLPIWEFALINFGKIIIWSLVGSLFDVRQSKRLFGLLTSGRWLAVAVGGLLVPLLVLLVGTTNLLWLAVVSLSVALALLVRVLRAYPQAFAKPVPLPDVTNPAPTQNSKSRSLLKNPFIVLIFIEAFIWIMAYFVNDNIYYIETARQYTNADELASVLGLLSSVAGFLTLLSGLFFTGPFISRFGVQTSVRVTPLLVDLLILAFAVVGTFFYNGQVVFVLAIVARTVNTFMSETFEVTSLRILVQPLPTDQRVRVSAVSDGIIEPLAIGTAGVLMVLIVDVLDLSSTQLAYLFLLIGIGWFAATSSLARRYRVVLTEALERRWLGQALPLTIDRSTVSILKPFLRDKHPEAVIYALHVLAESGEEQLVRDTVPELLGHPSARVRGEALEYIERLRMTAALPRVQQLLQTETDIHFREYGLRALAALDPQQAQPAVITALDAPEIPVRRGALVAMIRYGVGHAAVKAEAKLLALAAQADTPGKVLAAEVIGEVGLANYHHALEGLLKATAVPVRRAALTAAGKIKHPRLWPLVIEALAVPTTRVQAQAALVAGSDAALPAIRAAMADSQSSREVLMALARACGQMTNRASLDILTDRMKAYDPEVRTQVIMALSQRGYHAHDMRKIQSQIRYEADFYTRLLATVRDLGSGDGASLLKDALGAMARQTGDRILYLMGFIYDPATILRAREALLYGSGAVQATGLEILDTYADNQSKAYILPIFEDLPEGKRLEALSRALPQQTLTREGRILELLARPPTPWINVCALYAAGRLMIEGSRPLLPAAMNAADGLTRETARHTLDRLNKGIQGDKRMLSTIEKVIVLKTVGIFAKTPDEVLADVAGLLEEAHYASGEVIFNKGDLGNSLYMIVSGKVRVHDNNYTLNRLAERQVFGEMALLDPAPRIASVTALEDTHVFRLRQEAFYELLDNRGEVARGIIRVLTGYLRSWVENADLRMIQQSAAKTVPLPIKREADGSWKPETKGEEDLTQRQ